MNALQKDVKNPKEDVNRIQENIHSAFHMIRREEEVVLKKLKKFSFLAYHLYSALDLPGSTFFLQGK